MLGAWAPRAAVRIPAGVALLVFVFSAFFARAASALVLQMPARSAPVELPGQRVVCGTAPEGFIVDGTRRTVKPRLDLPAGTSAILSVSKPGAGCTDKTRENATLIVTGDLPAIDPASVTVWVDAQRLELQGERLEGVRIGYRAGEKAGSDICLNVAREKGRDACAVNIGEGLPADPRRIRVEFAPQHGRLGGDVVTYDLTGNMLPREQLEVPVGRVVISRLFPVSHAVDVASGEGKVELFHPEAVSTVECGAARCEVSDKGIIVRAVPPASATVTPRVQLQPRVFYAKGDATEAAVSQAMTVLRCPLTMVSGDPLRDVDELAVLVRFDPSCGKDVDRLRWTANAEIAQVKRVETLPDGVYVLLFVGRIASDRLRVMASRVDDGSVLAVVSRRTWELPSLHTSLSLPRIGEIEFIPKNRNALLTSAPAAGQGKLVPIPVPGAYEVMEKDGAYYIRGIYTSGGYVALRFAYRVPSLPAPFATTDFGKVSDPVQRPIREASVPAPIGASSVTKRPIVELWCAVEDGKVAFIPPGTAPHIPFSERDSCRLIIHRSRIPPKSGEQRLNVTISVTSVGGSERGDAKLSQQFVLRHGPEVDVIWISGAKEQFDRINIRVTHVIDESQYMSGTKGRLEIPSAQWTVVTENAHVRFYATAAIPGSLYRFSDDPGDLGTGPLALNFGVLSRFTWLDSEGKEGIVGLEAGVMGMGLATDRDRQLAIVGGLGVAIPLGNPNQVSQAAVNIHAWVAYSVGERTAPLTDDAGQFVRTVTLSPWAFVFGPSITIGNVGAFL